VDHPFQITRVDIMELPLTASGNRYAVVFKDLFTKWPLVFATPDQKIERIAKVIAKRWYPYLEHLRHYYLTGVQICYLI